MPSEEQLHYLHVELRTMAQFPPAQITKIYLETFRASNTAAMQAIGLLEVAGCPRFPHIPVIEADPNVLIDRRRCIRVCPYLRPKDQKGTLYCAAAGVWNFVDCPDRTSETGAVAFSLEEVANRIKKELPVTQKAVSDSSQPDHPEQITPSPATAATV